MSHYTFKHQILTLKNQNEMSKKTNGSIYYLKNYIQIQKLNCVLKIHFNNDQLNPRTEKTETLHATETKWDIRVYYQQAHCIHTPKVRELMFSNILEIVVVFKTTRQSLTLS